MEAEKDTSSSPLMATLQIERERGERERGRRKSGSKNLSSAPQAGRNQPYISQAYLHYLPVGTWPLFIQSRANESNKEHFNLSGRFFRRLAIERARWAASCTPSLSTVVFLFHDWRVAIAALGKRCAYLTRCKTRQSLWQFRRFAEKWFKTIIENGPEQYSQGVV